MDRYAARSKKRTYFRQEKNDHFLPLLRLYSLFICLESNTIPPHTENLLTWLAPASAVLGNVKDPLSHFEFPVMDIGKQLASVSKDNLPFDQSCTRL